MSMHVHFPHTNKENNTTSNIQVIATIVFWILFSCACFGFVLFSFLVIY